MLDSMHLRPIFNNNKQVAWLEIKSYLDLRKVVGINLKTYSPKWWFNGDESHGIESLQKSHQHHQIQWYQRASNPQILSWSSIALSIGKSPMFNGGNTSSNAEVFHSPDLLSSHTAFRNHPMFHNVLAQPSPQHCKSSHRSSGQAASGLMWIFPSKSLKNGGLEDEDYFPIGFRELFRGDIC